MGGMESWSVFGEQSGIAWSPAKMVLAYHPTPTRLLRGGRMYRGERRAQRGLSLRKVFRGDGIFEWKWGAEPEEVETSSCQARPESEWCLNGLASPLGIETPTAHYNGTCQSQGASEATQNPNKQVAISDGLAKQRRPALKRQWSADG